MIDISDGSMRLLRRGREEVEEEVEGAGGSAFSEVGTPQIALAVQMSVCGAVEGEIGRYKGWRLPSPELLATFYDGVVSQQVADAVHRSAEKGGEWMSIKDF